MAGAYLSVNMKRAEQKHHTQDSVHMNMNYIMYRCIKENL